MYKKVYVAVDNSEHSNRAVALGVELARALGARLVGSHVYAAKLHDVRFKQMEFTLPDEYKEETELEKQRRIHDALIARGLQLITDSYLDVMEARAREAGVELERRRLDGRTFEPLVQDLNDGECDLVVMGVLGQGAVRQSLVGSVCERVLRRISIDALVVRDAGDACPAPVGGPVEGDGAPLCVLLDGSPWSWGGLAAACRLARITGRPIEIVTARAADDPAREVLDAHLALAARLARGHEVTTTVRVLVPGEDEGVADQSGAPAATAVLRHVETCRPWLVVMGRHGIDADARAPELGSLVERMIGAAPCNVLVAARMAGTSPVREAARAGATPGAGDPGHVSSPSGGMTS
jgi:nucleotide-binding universal stress UspA family protein